MKIEGDLVITAADLVDGVYGPDETVEVTGSVRISSEIGIVRFRRALVARMKITAEAGSGIQAGEGIEAGWGIKAGWGIEAGKGIKAGWGIEAGGSIEAGEGLGIFAGLRLRLADWSIYARVIAKTKPHNLVSGSWVESAAEALA